MSQIVVHIGMSDGVERGQDCKVAGSPHTVLGVSPSLFYREFINKTRFIKTNPLTVSVGFPLQVELPLGASHHLRQQLRGDVDEGLHLPPRRQVQSTDTARVTAHVVVPEDSVW